jgi:hypothetical protein
MKVKRFAVSVQYGQGYHYFVKYDFETLPDAVKHAARVQKGFRAIPRKGAKPKVHIWEHAGYPVE